MSSNVFDVDVNWCFIFTSLQCAKFVTQLQNHYRTLLTFNDTKAKGKCFKSLIYNRLKRMVVSGGQGVAGSNPVVPTNKIKHLRHNTGLRNSRCVGFVP